MVLFRKTLVALVVIVSMGGCIRPQAPVAKPGPERVVNFGELPRLAATLPAAQVRGCQRSDECAVTYMRDGSCCDQLCAATNALRKDFIELLAHQRQVQRERGSCRDVRCPIAMCLATNIEHTAQCIGGQCTYVPIDHSTKAPAKGAPPAQ